MFYQRLVLLDPHRTLCAALNAADSSESTCSVNHMKFETCSFSVHQFEIVHT